MASFDVRNAQGDRAWTRPAEGVWRRPQAAAASGGPRRSGRRPTTADRGLCGIHSTGARTARGSIRRRYAAVAARAASRPRPTRRRTSWTAESAYATARRTDRAAAECAPTIAHPAASGSRSPHPADPLGLMFMSPWWPPIAVPCGADAERPMCQPNCRRTTGATRTHSDRRRAPSQTTGPTVNTVSTTTPPPLTCPAAAQCATVDGTTVARRRPTTRGQLNPCSMGEA